MKRLPICLVIGAVLLAVGFVGGRLFQHAKTGFHFKVLAEKQYGTPDDPVRWRCVSESIGMPFLDPETTIIDYRGRTIFKAQCDFQESVPVAANIRASGNRVDWDDGEFQYHLTVEDMKQGGAGATNEVQPLNPEATRTSPETGSGH